MKCIVRRAKWGMAALLSFILAAEAHGAGQPILSSCELYQMGDSEVVIGLMGEQLPEPELEFSGPRVRIVLRDTRVGPEAAPPPLSFPLISAVRVEQAAGAAVAEVVTAVPLRLRFRYGEPPAGRYTFRLAAEERPGPSLPIAEADNAPSPILFPEGAEEVTLDFRDIELQYLLLALGGQMRKNVIIDPSLPSVQVSMTLAEMPVKELLDYLVRAFGLSFYPLGDDVLIFGTREGLARLSGEEETRAFDLAYADPAAVQKLLAALTGLPTGSLNVDLRLRTLYVTANPLKLREVARLVSNLDRPGRQVMIHARIFEFTDEAARDVETALNTVYGHWWLSYAGKAGARGGYIQGSGQGDELTAPSSGYPLPLMTGLDTALKGVWHEFDLAFSALEEKGRGKTLANPSVIALDGQEAKISMVEDYPYIAHRDEAGNPTWSRTTVGPQLTLTPRVGRDGFLTLQLTAETGEVIEKIVGSTGEQMPRTSTRSVTTHIRVRDGEPFVVGGLFRENQARRRARVPIVGQIPLLGPLFTYRYDEHNKTQVVILVVPYILHS